MSTPNSGAPDTEGSDNRFKAYIALGGNEGDVVASMVSAIDHLTDDRTTSVIDYSRLYKTPPWGVEDQDWFINACITIETELSPINLLRRLKDIEQILERKKTIRWGPRNIDLDLLIYEGETLKTEKLEIPHPRMTDRGFVLMPLNDIAGKVVVNGKTIKDWLSSADCDGIVIVPDQKGWKSGGVG